MPGIWHRRAVAATGQMAGAKVKVVSPLVPMRANIPTRNNRLILVEVVRAGVALERCRCPCSNLHKVEKDWRFSWAGRTVTVMVTILCALVSIFEFRVRSRASLELELIALRHQVTVLRRQRPGRPQLSSVNAGYIRGGIFALAHPCRTVVDVKFTQRTEVAKAA